MVTKIGDLSVTFNDTTEQKTALTQGIILIWSGNIIDIPTGWQLCDGTNGTPDLRDRFVVGAGGAYAVGATGGETTVTLTTPQLPVHTHTVTVSSVGPAGSHSHGGSFLSSFSGFSHTHTISPAPVAAATGPNNYNASPGGQFGSVNATQPSGSHSHGYTIGPAGGHSHGVTSVTVGDIGAGDPHENRPPYYALAFIMETA